MIISPVTIHLANITPESLIKMAVTALIGACGFGSFIFLLLGGVKYITSGGDKSAVEAAQKTITSALIGVALAAATWAIAHLLESILGISILSVSI